MDNYTIYCGDALATLKNLPDNHYDACLSDPPYGLNFMGKEWDRGVPSAEVWAELLRVLKPGGYALVFGGTRTFHRLAVNLEDAGFVVKDCLSWLYGSGFPKSHNISKALDKQRTEDKEPVRVVCRYLRAAMDAAGVKSKHLVQHFDGCHPRLIDHWAARDTDSQPAVPTWEQWQKLREVLGLGDGMDAEVWRLNGRKGQPGDNWDRREVVGQVTNSGNYTDYAEAVGGSAGFKAEYNITAPATDAARQWDGYGTALKPAWEPCLLVQKPLDGTYANNVLAHGCGALNIDGCRVGRTEGDRTEYGRDKVLAHANTTSSLGKFDHVEPYAPHDAGRFPANLILDEAAAEALDATTDNASRFFYTAKVSTKERNAGCEDLPDREGADWPQGGVVAGNQNRGTTVKNNHPTLKPLSLTEYLAKLLLPATRAEGAEPRRIIVPFSGAGSEVIGCMQAGWDEVHGIELDPEYVAIAKARIAHWQR